MPTNSGSPLGEGHSWGDYLPRHFWLPSALSRHLQPKGVLRQKEEGSARRLVAWKNGVGMKSACFGWCQWVPLLPNPLDDLCQHH